MPNRLQRTLQEIKEIAQSNQGRHCIYLGGAVIAGAYFGYIGPEALEALYAGAALFATAHPVMAFTEIVDVMYQGAQTGTASMVQHIADTIGVEGSELTHTARETLHQCRDILNRYSDRGVDFLKDFFNYAASSIGEGYQWVKEFCAEFYQQVSNTAPDGQDIKEVFGSAKKYAGYAAAGVIGIWTGLGMAKDAFDYFETGQKIFRWFKKDKPLDQPAPEANAKHIHININVTRTTDHTPKEGFDEVRAGHQGCEVDGLIWASEDFLKPEKPINIASQDLLRQKNDCENIDFSRDGGISDPEIAEDQVATQRLLQLKKELAALSVTVDEAIHSQNAQRKTKEQLTRKDVPDAQADTGPDI